MSVDVGTGYRLEPMRPGHLDDVLAIDRSGPGRSWSREAFAGEMDQDGRCYLVAVEDRARGRRRSRVIGFAGSMRIEEAIHITTVAVASDRRREGVGYRLVTELLRSGREGGACSATLEVRTGNAAARELYRRLGFAPVGARRRYYTDTGEDAIIMWLHDLDRAPLLEPRTD